MDSRCVSIPIYGISLIFIIGLVNGLYKEALFNFSQAAYWLQDIAHFVIIPAALFYILSNTCGYKFKDFGLIKPSKGYPLAELLGASIFSAFILYVVYISVLVTSYHTLKEYGQTAAYFNYNSVIPTGPLGIVVVLYFATTAATVEEIVYRGIPYKLMTAYKLFSKKTYVVGTSLLFAAIHWENGYGDLLAAFIFGLLAAYLYLVYRNLWPLIGAHFLIDLYVFW